MKRSLFILSLILVIGSVTACRDDKKPTEEPKPGTKDTSTDATAEWREACAKTSGHYFDCATAKSGESVILTCDNSKFVQAAYCYENSTCSMDKEKNEAVCGCNTGYDLTANNGGYYCKQRDDYPQEVFKNCADSASDHSACVTSGSDVWAVDCFDGKPYANDGTGNCTKLNKKCSEVIYQNGIFHECVDCLNDNDCTVPSDLDYEHAGAVCNNGTCLIGCEFGWKYSFDEDLEEASCEKIKDPCHKSSDCTNTIPHSVGICNNFACEYACVEGWKNVWNEGVWSCEEEIKE